MTEFKKEAPLAPSDRLVAQLVGLALFAGLTLCGVIMSAII